MIILTLIIALLFAATLAALYVMGRKASRRLAGTGSRSIFTVSMTPSGLALAGCLVITQIGFRAAAVFAPSSPLGSLLQTEGTQFEATVIAVVCFVIAAALSTKFGKPIFKRGARVGSNNSLDRTRKK